MTSHADSMKSLRDIIMPIIEGIRALLRPERMSVDFPDEFRAVPENYRGVIVHDYDKCTGCRLCCKVCPSTAIDLQYSLDGKYRPCIDYSKCIFCGLCADACPTGALRHVRYQEIVTESKNTLRFRPGQLRLDNLRKILCSRDEHREVTYEISGKHIRKVRARQI